MVRDSSFLSIKRLPNYQYMDLCGPHLIEARGRGVGAVREGVKLCLCFGQSQGADPPSSMRSEGR
jgi:hypothetical protein